MPGWRRTSMLTRAVASSVAKTLQEIPGDTSFHSAFFGARVLERRSAAGAPSSLIRSERRSHKAGDGRKISEGQLPNAAMTGRRASRSRAQDVHVLRWAAKALASALDNAPIAKP